MDWGGVGGNISPGEFSVLFAGLVLNASDQSETIY